MSGLHFRFSLKPEEPVDPRSPITLRASNIDRRNNYDVDIHLMKFLTLRILLSFQPTIWNFIAALKHQMLRS